MSKKKGSLIIENIFAMAIILIVISCICDIVGCRYRWQIIKNKKEELLRIGYCIEQEIKYNLTINEIKEISNNNIINLSKDNILKILTTDTLHKIPSGDDILISIEDISEERINVYICVKDEYNGNYIKSERIFIKDSVMNEFYK